VLTKGIPVVPCETVFRMAAPSRVAIARRPVSSENSADRRAVVVEAENLKNSLQK